MSSLHHLDPDGPIDVLLVEDNPGDVRLIREAFEETERETTIEAVTSGTDALESLRRGATNEGLPGLVLLDLNLSGRDGSDVLAEIRDDPRLQYLPVIVLTGSTAEEDVVRCYESCANAYLIKPSDPDEFHSLAESIEQFWLETARLPPVPA